MQQSGQNKVPCLATMMEESEDDDNSVGYCEWVSNEEDDDDAADDDDIHVEDTSEGMMYIAVFESIVVTGDKVEEDLLLAVSIMKQLDDEATSKYTFL